MGMTHEELSAYLQRFPGARQVAADERVPQSCPTSCWGTCCRRVEVRLTPHDVASLAAQLRVGVNRVIIDYCDVTTGPTGWPEVRLRAAATGDCAFLGRWRRCSVYEGRPTSCRSSPLGRVQMIDREGHSDTQLVWVPPAPECQIQAVDGGAPAAEILAEQDVQAHWDRNDPYHELIAWAVHELHVRDWRVPLPTAIIVMLLYAPGVVARMPADATTEEQLRRGREAARVLLQTLGAVNGYGPSLVDALVGPHESVQRSIAVLLTGEAPPKGGDWQLYDQAGCVVLQAGEGRTDAEMRAVLEAAVAMGGDISRWRLVAGGTEMNGRYLLGMLRRWERRAAKHE